MKKICFFVCIFLLFVNIDRSYADPSASCTGYSAAAVPPNRNIRMSETVGSICVNARYVKLNPISDFNISSSSLYFKVADDTDGNTYISSIILTNWTNSKTVAQDRLAENYAVLMTMRF